MKTSSPKPPTWSRIFAYKQWVVDSYHGNPWQHLVDNPDKVYYRTFSKANKYYTEQRGFSSELNHAALPQSISDFIKAHTNLLS